MHQFSLLHTLCLTSIHKHTWQRGAWIPSVCEIMLPKAPTPLLKSVFPVVYLAISIIHMRKWKKEKKPIIRNLLFSGAMTLLKMQHLSELVQLHFDARRVLCRWRGLVFSKAAKWFEKPAAMATQPKNGSAPTSVQLSAHNGS